MDLNTRKERFSLAYINAVAYIRQCRGLSRRWTEDSVDGSFDGGFPYRRPIEFQAKATARTYVRVASMSFSRCRYEKTMTTCEPMANPAYPDCCFCCRMTKPNGWRRADNDTTLPAPTAVTGSLCGGTNRPYKPNSDNVTVRIPTGQHFQQLTAHRLDGQGRKG